MSDPLQQAADALADDGGPQVSHVHLLGDVGGGEVHNCPLPVHDGGSRSLLQHRLLHEARNGLRSDVDVDVTGTYPPGGG